MLEHAVKFIKNGQLVIFPTETVYGIGADATNELACKKIFTAKGRPSHNPLIVHVANIDQAKTIAIFNDFAEKLSSLWPGPLTLVLPLSLNHKIAPSVTASLSTVAVRIPSHDIALQLIKNAASPIAAPSANLSGSLSSTALEQVQESFGQQENIYIIRNQQECNIGLESTIIDLSSSIPIILRQGYFTQEFLSDYLGINVKIADETSIIKAPGMLLKHYAPKTKVRLNAEFLLDNELGLNFANSNLNAEFSLNLSPNGNLIEAAANLYYYLYQLDEYAQKNNYNQIAVAPVPKHDIGSAINDRLLKASN
ncbi:MAG: threonylcarbamoyl-AMP synthase [Rickettsiaceae bacterium]|nr:threonylcarbamoyl-AMP synthase [Rickettsiaceae bacterium]